MILKVSGLPVIIPLLLTGCHGFTWKREKKTCVFPYIYDGKTYHGCYPGQFGRWCPYQLNDGHYRSDRWVYCEFGGNSKCCEVKKQ